ncbi:hypothetical protein ALON55S_04678 [Alishewanella longhuensis]
MIAASDLAACKYRSIELNADRIVIFTDARQALHFKQVEITARKAGLLAAHPVRSLPLWHHDGRRW